MEIERTNLINEVLISTKSGLNRRRSELQSDALPIELFAGPIEYDLNDHENNLNEERRVPHAQS